MKPGIKILGVGSPMLDILVNVEDDFLTSIDARKGGMDLADSAAIDRILDSIPSKPKQAPGGSSANTIFGLAMLGMPTAFLGKAGRDPQGNFYMKRYKRMGGDISRFKISAEKPTGRCLSLITPDSERTMKTDLGAAALLSPEDIMAADFAGVTHVHTEGYLLYNSGLTRRVLECAKESGCSVSLDLSSFGVVNASRKILPELLGKYVDIVFANEDEAEAFCGKDEPHEALAALAACCETVAVKLGRKGSILRSGSRTAEVEAELVKAVDTTGAGDLWQSGFLFGFLQKMPLDVCGRLGSILGAEVVKVTGAEIPAERWRKIREKIKILSHRSHRIKF